MAGRGPAPKPADKRARRNKAPEMTVIEVAPVEPPNLPEGQWCEATRAWWEMWQRSPLAPSFSEMDWAFLLDTALLHQQLWALGDTRVLPELRLRVAKFGATPEDRARLRVQFAQADVSESQAERVAGEKRAHGSRARARAVRAV